MRYVIILVILILMVMLMAGSGQRGLRAGRSILLVLAGLTLMVFLLSLIVKLRN
jgi:hypothetical protein